MAFFDSGIAILGHNKCDLSFLIFGIHKIVFHYKYSRSKEIQGPRVQLSVITSFVISILLDNYFPYLEFHEPLVFVNFLHWRYFHNSHPTVAIDFLHILQQTRPKQNISESRDSITQPSETLNCILLNLSNAWQKSWTELHLCILKQLDLIYISVWPENWRYSFHDHIECLLGRQLNEAPWLTLHFGYSVSWTTICNLRVNHKAAITLCSTKFNFDLNRQTMYISGWKLPLYNGVIWAQSELAQIEPTQYWSLRLSFIMCSKTKARHLLMRRKEAKVERNYVWE